MSIPKPRASPQLPPNDLGPEEPSGSHPVVVRDLRESMLKNYAATAVGILAVGFSAYFTVMHEAKAQSDAGIAVSEAKQAQETAQLKTEVGILKVKTDYVEGAVQRQEQKMDKLLEALRIPNPAPAPKDGGH